MLAWVLAFALLGSAGGVLAAALLLAFPQGVRRMLVPGLVSFATGTMLGTAFLGLLPAASESLDMHRAGLAVLAGIGGFFVLEQLLLRHAHGEEGAPEHGRPAPLILVGDAFHNFVDGIVIAVAFLASVPLGIAAALSVAAHEVPQEVGDFAVLLDEGWPRGKALGWNVVSSLATVPGALAGWYWLADAERLVPYALALAAASFVYVAMADLIPGMRTRLGAAAIVRRLLLMLAGIALIAWIAPGHGH